MIFDGIFIKYEDFQRVWSILFLVIDSWLEICSWLDYIGLDWIGILEIFGRISKFAKDFA